MTALADVIAFLLELGVYVAVGHYAFTRVCTCRGRRALGLAVTLATIGVYAAVWWIFGAPGATVPLHGAARAALEILWFGSGATALALTGRRRTAAAFAALYLLGVALRAF